MENHKTSQPQIVDRSTLLQILNAAVTTGQTKFARRLSAAWLNNYSGDLAVEYYQAQALLKDSLFSEAIPSLKQICFTDPEYLPAQQLLAYSGQHAEYGSIATAKACIAVLSGSSPETSSLPNWANFLIQAQKAIHENDHAAADAYFRQSIQEQPDTPLPAVLHLKFAASQFDWKIKYDLGKEYTSRYPDSLACLLIHADTLTSGGQQEQAVELLHHAASLDIGGQVAVQLWGKQHAYIDLWPRNPRIKLSIPIPAEVAAVLGWNQLPEGELATDEAVPHIQEQELQAHSNNQEDLLASKEVIETARAEFERLAQKLNKSDLGQGDGRYPAYILVTSLQGLEKQYGTEQLAAIDKALKQVVKSTQAMPNWNAHLLYVDEATSADRFGLPPARPNDPWSIKTLISDLDRALGRRGEMIGAILIVGGPDVIPFHHLPNPIDDFDTDVPSDNPYASSDENYFVPTWPLGRIPGSSSSDAAPLISQLEKISQNRLKTMEKQPSSVISRLLNFIISRINFRSSKNSFGYSAEVWQRAAHSVYRPIGKAHTLMVSPPIEAKTLNGRKSKPSKLAYYNLHGLEDAPDWYGQRDPIETFNGPDYPVALRPKDIQNSGNSPDVVFSEACFGANIFNKTIEDAIALKFLDSGTKAVIGSTCTSYGSIAPPLIAADLLGKAFWSFLKDGFPVGESLRRAKIHLAKEMNRRQGYLDGEDQKTLVSFVLYGDPLAQPDLSGEKTTAKSNLRLTFNSKDLRTVCDKVEEPGDHSIPPEVVRQVKSVVKQYLPGMGDAQVLYSHEHLTCEGHDCPTHFLGAKAIPDQTPNRKVVTLSKQFDRGQCVHHQHARITINAEGKMIKLAVSR